MSNVPSYRAGSGLPVYSPVSGRPAKCWNCREDAVGCCQKLRINWTDSHAVTSNYDVWSNLAQGGPDVFEYSSASSYPFSPVHRITCQVGGDLPVAPPLNVLQLFDLATLTEEYFFYMRPGCPSLNPADWTNWVDGTHLAGTLNSITCMD